MDASLSAQRRAELLLREMTLEEKVGQMCQYVGPCYMEPDAVLAKVSVEAVRVGFDITSGMLQRWGASEEWSLEPGEFTIMTGPFSADEDLKSVSFSVEQESSTNIFIF